MSMTLAQTEALFQAFADPTRIRIVNLLGSGELCVCQIVYVLGMSQPKISRHLAILRDAGMVSDRKDGRWVHYSLTRPASNLQARLIGCARECFADVELLRDDLSRLRRAPALSTEGAACCE